STMMKGTKKYSSLDLSQTMEQNGIKITPSAGADTFSITTKPVHLIFKCTGFIYLSKNIY
ncbi:MAG: hypothetical protein IJ300_04525, partial [Clostridia bacterium]|nr:hypothetical protein [Clostridia bacterium]